MAEKIQVSEGNQKRSEEKWDEAYERVMNEIPFDNATGWYDLEIIDSCGYCDEVSAQTGGIYCDRCILFPGFCHSNGAAYPKTIFWQFVEEMQAPFCHEDTNWRRAKKFCSAMRAKIKKIGRDAELID